MAARSARWQQFLQELVMVAGTVSQLLLLMIDMVN